MKGDEALLKLARFGWACIKEHRDAMCDIDGATAQEMAIASGVLVSRVVHEPCGDDCQCSEFGFPNQCFFIDDECKALMEPKA